MSDIRNEIAYEFEGFDDVVSRLESLREHPPAVVRSEHLAAILAANPGSLPLDRKGWFASTLARAAAFLAAFIVAAGGLTAADALPAPIQDVTNSVFRFIGIDLGDHDPSVGDGAESTDDPDDGAGESGDRDEPKGGSPDDERDDGESEEVEDDDGRDDDARDDELEADESEDEESEYETDDRESEDTESDDRESDDRESDDDESDDSKDDSVHDEASDD